MPRQVIITLSWCSFPVKQEYWRVVCVCMKGAGRMERNGYSVCVYVCAWLKKKSQCQNKFILKLFNDEMYMSSSRTIFCSFKYNLKTRSMEKQKHSVLYEKDKHKSDALSHLFICLKCFIIKSASKAVLLKKRKRQ